MKPIYKRAYQAWSPNPESANLVLLCNNIIADYRTQGFTLTLRQLYYQLVARDVIANNVAQYNKLGNVVSRARRAGMLDWNAIEDRTRFIRERTHWNSPSHIVQACVDSYHVDMWVGQKWRPEVWIEKDALVGVIETTCSQWDVPHFSCRGYSSDSELHVAAKRMVARMDTGTSTGAPCVIHLGDHDPSGIDMTRDIEDRLKLFAGARIPVKRIALNMDQIDKYNPPPNPAKLTDSRVGKYLEQFGESSWELDALSPSDMATLITDEITALIDPDVWQEREVVKRDGIAELRKVQQQLEGGA